MVCLTSESSAQTTDEMLKEAATLVEQEKWNSASDAYTRILKKEPKNPAALFFRAYVYEQLGKYKLSRNDYEQFLKIAPFNYEGLLGLAVLNQKDKKYTDA